MCSIIAYKGYRDAAPIIVKALRRMEYRGYDSVGVATAHNSILTVKKGAGNVSYVNSRLNLDSMDGSVGIGHTRWATHGVVSDTNAHPHLSCDGRIAVVHNGVVENYEELKSILTAKGHTFRSETDSEVIVHLLEEALSELDAQTDGNMLGGALLDTSGVLRGSYSFVALISRGVLVGARYHEPLMIGLGNPSKGNDGKLLVDECFIASDALAFIEYTDKAIFLADGEVFVVRYADTSEQRLVVEIFDRNGKTTKEITHIAWEFAGVDKGRFAHYTLKEIHEQRYTIERAFNTHANTLHGFIDILINADSIIVTGSGSSYHAALMARHLFSRLCMLGCDAVVASEFMYAMNMHVNNNNEYRPLLLAVSQSGETADVLNAVRIARDNNFKIISIVNSPLSTLARESDAFLSIDVGPEIGVAATKSFTAQLALLYRISREVARIKGITPSVLESSSMHVDRILEEEEHIMDLAESIKHVNSIYVIAKGIHHVIALEGALKLKELAYVHAEGMHAGELKHGPLALIDEKSVVIALNPMDDTYNDMLTSVHEAKARGAYVVGVSDSHNNIYDFTLTIPRVHALLYPLYEVIPLQLLAYHMALKRDCNPDYPRNIAKSVTVK